MSNPVGPYIIFDVYDNRFRDTWLKAALSVDEYNNITGLNISILRELYPDIYKYGPNGQTVKSILHALVNRIRPWADAYEKDGEINPQAVDFFQSLWALMNNHPNLPANETARLHEQMRPLAFKMDAVPYNQPGDTAYLRRKHGTINRLAGRVGENKNKPIGEIEQLLTDTMLLDQIQKAHPTYAAQYTIFLETWQLRG